VSSAERSGINRTARICRIGVEPAYRPDWFDPDADAHVPLPPADVAAGRRISLLSREAGEPHIRYDWPSWKRYVLGEYLWRALDEARRRPRFLIEAHVGRDPAMSEAAPPAQPGPLPQPGRASET